MEDIKREKEELEAKNRDKDRQLEKTSEDINRSLASLHDQEKVSSALHEENESLKSRVSFLEEELENSKEEVNKAQDKLQSAKQENSKLQTKLSNAETHSAHQDNAVQKLRNEIDTLQERNKSLEKKGSEIEQKVTQEVQRKLQDRIRELEEKVIKVNDEKKKIKADYEEAVKALEAVDKVVNISIHAYAKKLLIFRVM